MNRKLIWSSVLALGFIWPKAVFASENWLDQLSLYIRTEQQSLHRQLADALQAVAEGGFYAMLGLLTISFLYGVFHAAGPGHGKAVISAYILSQKSHLKQSVLLSVAAAMVQGLSAILLVKAFAALVFFSSWAIKDMVPVMEQTSFLFVALIGLYLLIRGIRQLRQTASPAHVHHHDHGAHSHGSHSHGAHGGEVCGECGHLHAVSPEVAAQASGFKERLAIILSVGIRPCSGSVIVLTFAELLGLGFAGIISVLAISTGTAITVSLLAICAVFFRDIMLSFTEHASGGQLLAWVKYLPAMLSLIGGGFIVFLGVTLFLDGLQSQHPLM